MKQRLTVFGLLGVFWVAFFVIARALFMLYHHDLTSLLTLSDVGMIFLLGLRMDLAMTGYWLLLPGLLLAIPIKNTRPLYYVQNFFTIVCLLVSSMIVVVDLELYAHWGFRMNTAPLDYVGSAAAGSVNPGALIWLVVLLLTLVGVSVFAYLRLLSKRFLQLPPIALWQSGILVLVTACLIIPIRSSFTVAPLNSGVVYFHKTMAFPNHAGINVTWNFLNSLTAQEEVKYPTDFYTADFAPEVVREMETSGQVSKKLFKSARPNVLLIVLESFTAKIVEPLSGMKEITPNLNGLIHEGVLFDNFYASGDRTDKGLVAILSGYPSQPLTSIIKFPEKTLHLPYLPRTLSNLGYNTSFVYGGDIGFANMESYLTTAGFSHITEDDDFSITTETTKWGVADHVVFDRLLAECDTARSPFFKVMLTLSSHEPFDVPMEPFIKETDERSLFLNACHYTDRSLGEFIQKARKSSWWNNTVIIITADHGHHYPDNAEELKEKGRFRIPLLFVGGDVAKKDTVIHILGGQTDIANTLLAQVDESLTEFRFSKNIVGKNTKPFAVYVYNNGFGYIDPAGESIYDFDLKSYVKLQGSAENQMMGKAYMQILFNDYNAR